MGILLNKNSRVIVQGITGYQGKFHTNAMQEYGTQIIAGVTPGRKGEMVHGVPVYDLIDEIPSKDSIDASIIYVPGPAVLAAAIEAISAGISLLVIITEHVPVWDAAKIMEYAKQHHTKVIGPNCPGLITPGQAKLGIIPGKICVPGTVGIVSRSGTLTYEVIQQLTNNHFGQSTCVGIGGDPIHGMGFIDVISELEADSGTNAIVMLGEIGGNEEELAAAYIKDSVKKPVIAYIAGRTAPPGKQMGHAGAITSGHSGTAETKINALKKAGVHVALTISEIPMILSHFF